MSHSFTGWHTSVTDHCRDAKLFPGSSPEFSAVLAEAVVEPVWQPSLLCLSLLYKCSSKASLLINSHGVHCVWESRELNPAEHRGSDLPPTNTLSDSICPGKKTEDLTGTKFKKHIWLLLSTDVRIEKVHSFLSDNYKYFVFTAAFGCI